MICIPCRLEYSAKDDKFRVQGSVNGNTVTINMARVTNCVCLEHYSPEDFRPINYREKHLVMELQDDRNGLERVLLAFSDLEKETVKLDDRNYRVTLWYKGGDITEILIRILSFGPILKVTEPISFVKLIRERLNMQMHLAAEQAE